jgi:hypothetical protein
MWLRRAPEKYIAGAALDRTGIDGLQNIQQVLFFILLRYTQLVIFHYILASCCTVLFNKFWGYVAVSELKPRSLVLFVE